MHPLVEAATSITTCVAVVSVWRGVWILQDHLLVFAADRRALSGVASFVLGAVLLTALGAWQRDW